MSLFDLLRQLPFPGARDHRRGKPTDADSIVQRQLSQPVIINTLQRKAKLTIILFGDMFTIALLQFGVESAKRLSDYGKFLYQRMTMPRITMIECTHHYPSHVVA
ncbi:protein of unknown function [Candidatus Methylomirabilis oxygeniifera]|uniref:Uncharacterized protein n=1 Tax=Methylomirabilis oxygeniifera TaxID=671143 RepID=D5MN29_METO1|nr:protein of unknown function [Candidatus Methylomirabilis oxyfera]